MFLSTHSGIVIIFVVAVFVSKIFDVVIHQLCVAGLSLSQDPMVYAWCRLPGLPGNGYLLLDLVSLGRDVPGFMPTCVAFMLRLSAVYVRVHVRVRICVFQRLSAVNCSCGSMVVNCRKATIARIDFWGQARATR